MDDVIAVFSNPSAVSDQNKGLIVDLVDSAEKIHDFSACGGV